MQELGAREYFTGDSIWNFLDLLTLCSTLVTIVGIFFFEDYKEETLLFCSIAVLSAWLNLLYFFRGFRASGSLVRTIVKMTGIVYFVIMMIIVNIGFSLFFFIYVVRSDGKYSVPAISSSSFVDYLAWLTDYLAWGFLFFVGEVGHFDGAGDNYLSVEGCMIILYVIIGSLVMANLLIAIMGDIYDNVQEKANAQYLHNLARIMIDYEILIKYIPRIPCFTSKSARWIQVLVPLHDGEYLRKEAWSGRVKAQTAAISIKMHEMETNLNLKIEKQLSEIMKMAKTMDGLQSKIDEVIAFSHSNSS